MGIELNERVRIIEQKDVISHRRQIAERLKSKILISPNNIPAFVYPIVEFIHTVKPDYIIANDRGGRLTALATGVLYQELYGELSTRDRMILFRRMSKRTPRAEMKEKLRADVNRMLSESENPQLLVIDDYVNFGRTKRLVNRAISELSQGRIKVFYGVMRGVGADVSADKLSLAGTSWRNRSDIIGVSYANNSHIAERVGSERALRCRREIVANTRNFARRIARERIET